MASEICGFSMGGTRYCTKRGQVLLQRGEGLGHSRTVGLSVSSLCPGHGPLHFP